MNVRDLHHEHQLLEAGGAKLLVWHERMGERTDYKARRCWTAIDHTACIRYPRNEKPKGSDAQPRKLLACTRNLAKKGHKEAGLISSIYLNHLSCPGEAFYLPDIS